MLDILIALGFSKLVKNVYEDKQVLAFYHPKPTYKLHILIVPKHKIISLDKAKETDLEIILHIIKTAKMLIQDLKIKDYRLITNGGIYQKFKYLHFHLVSDDYTSTSGVEVT